MGLGHLAKPRQARVGHASGRLSHVALEQRATLVKHAVEQQPLRKRCVHLRLHKRVRLALEVDRGTHDLLEGKGRLLDELALPPAPVLRDGPDVSRGQTQTLHKSNENLAPLMKMGANLGNKPQVGAL